MILEVEMFALVLQLVLDIEFGVFFQGQGLMKVAGFLVPFNWNLGIFGVVNDPRDVPIGLCIVCHEAFEMWLQGSTPSHDVVEVMLEKHLSIHVFGWDDLSKRLS